MSVLKIVHMLNRSHLANDTNLLHNAPYVIASINKSFNTNSNGISQLQSSSINQQQFRFYGKKHNKKDSSSSSSSSSSDDEKAVKHKGKTGQTKFWRQKMRTHHVVIDINKDGVVSWDDFEVLIKNFTVLGNLGVKEIEKFTSAMKHVWEDEWGAAGDPYAFIGQEQFLNNMEHAVNTSDLRKKLARQLPYFFQAVDYDSSGEISIEEFTTFYKCLGLSAEAANEAFAAIDVNGDGRLSKKEFVKYGKEFFLSEDETSPSKVFWGPLCP